MALENWPTLWSICWGGRGACHVNLILRFLIVIPTLLSPAKNTFRPMSHLNRSTDSSMTVGVGAHDGVGMNFIPMPRIDIAGVGSDLPLVRSWNVLFVEWQK